MQSGTPSKEPMNRDRPTPSSLAAASPSLTQGLILLSVLISGVPLYSAHAQSIVTNGDVNPTVPSPPPSIWNIGGRLYVGQTGTGTLSIADGSIVNISNGYVGQAFGSYGVAAVSGTGSAWNAAGSFYIGHYLSLIHI